MPGDDRRPAVKLSASHDGQVDVAIDGAGTAIAVFEQIHASGSNNTATAYTSTRPAGGSWGPPAVLSVPGDDAVTPRIVADAAGTFVVAWVDNTTQTISVLTSPPGGGFGSAATFTATALDDLKIALGHAVLAFGSSFTGEPVNVSSEPVS